MLVLPVVSGCISICDIAGVVVGCNLSSLSLCTQLDFSRVAHISGVLHRLHYRLAGICGKFILVESLSSFDIDLKKSRSKQNLNLKARNHTRMMRVYLDFFINF